MIYEYFNFDKNYILRYIFYRFTEFTKSNQQNILFMGT